MKKENKLYLVGLMLSVPFLAMLFQVNYVQTDVPYLTLALITLFAWGWILLVVSIFYEATK